MRLSLGYSPGAFTLPDEREISPLYAFFEVANTGEVAAEVRRIGVEPADGSGVFFGEGFEGERSLPCTLSPGESVRFWVRAKTLARALRDAGYGGRPRLRFVAEDSSGGRHDTGFRFRVDEYLNLRDE
ncbi:hypothetical protein [Rubrobacter calidifluminis]|uniref:hypothetical protein n=1 Tax=Rubrobacter calidifluminis TaxID=1392640 RepID=UPI002361ED4D|nr:hypothetical protein [Rubrobacter calidifluminis]